MDLEKRFDRLEEMLITKFEQFDKRFDQIDQRFEQIDQRFEKVDKRFDQIEQKFDIVESKLEDVEMLYGKMHTWLGLFSESHNTLNNKITVLEAKQKFNKKD